VASKEEQSKAVSDKGFGGLMSMASKVDVIGTIVREQKSDQSPGEIPANCTPLPPKGSSPEGPEGNSPLYQGPLPRPPVVTPIGKWLLGLGAGIGVLWLLASMNDSPVPRPSQQMPNQSAPTITPPFDQLDSRSSRLAEEIPSAGTNLVLGPTQIRYCLAEDIRIDAARSALNEYLQFDVDRFNAMVSDYNSRCGNFRYRKGSLESARAEIERRRPTLEAEGRSRFAR